MNGESEGNKIRERAKKKKRDTGFRGLGQEVIKGPATFPLAIYVLCLPACVYFISPLP